MHQSIPAAPIPPSGQLRGICTHCQSRGSGFSLPQSYSPGFWWQTWFLTRNTNIEEVIGKDKRGWSSSLGKDQLFITDWLVRQGRRSGQNCGGLTVFFLDLSILCIFSLVIKQQLELSVSIHCSVIGRDRREFVFPRKYQGDVLLVFRIQNDIPGVGHLPSIFVPTLRYLPSKTKNLPPPQRLLQWEKGRENGKKREKAGILKIQGRAGPHSPSCRKDKRDLCRGERGGNEVCGIRHQRGIGDHSPGIRRDHKPWDRDQQFLRD